MQAHTLHHSSSATAPPRGRSSAVAVGWSPLQRCSRSNQQDIKCNSGPRERTKWYGVYTDEQYQAQRQSEERARWAASVRDLTGDRSHPEWAAAAAAAGGGGGGLLDPPALLGGVTVVIISPRKPVTVGTVARACGSFECEDLRIVMPRQQSYITRHAKSASKGAQYILYGAGHYDSIAEATADCDVRVAFTRWAQASSPHVYKVDINGLTAHPAVQRVVTAPLDYRPGPPPPPSAPSEEAAAAAEAAEARLAGTASSAGTASDSGTASDGEESDAADAAPAQQGVLAPASGAQQHHQEQQGSGSATTYGVGQGASSSHDASGVASAGSGLGSGAGHARPPKVALVFGREELGMSDEEVDSCEVCCSVPIGRLQESLSLSHAVSIALCSIYQARLQHLASSSSSGGSSDAGSSSSSSSSGQGAAGSSGPGAGRGSVKIDASTGMVSRTAAAAS